jgi:uncharacterized protein YbjT (DUF2867 family)
MKAIIVGSSGLVGSSLVKQLDNDDAFTNIRALVRKKSGHMYRKVEEIEVDFNN